MVVDCVLETQYVKFVPNACNVNFLTCLHCYIASLTAYRDYGIPCSISVMLHEEMSASLSTDFQPGKRLPVQGSVQVVSRSAIAAKLDQYYPVAMQYSSDYTLDCLSSLYL